MLFFFHATATTEIYTLSLHDALPIYADTSVCPGENVTLLAEGADSYSWFGPNGFNSTENPAYIIDISMDQAGIYYVEGLNNEGCFGEDSVRSEEHTSELQSRPHLVCRLLLEKK